MSGTWYIGAAINLVGSIMINLGTNVMKLGHNKRAALEARVGKKCAIRKFREWQIGVVLFIVGNLANFISFGYAAQSLLAALGSIQFVSNVGFAYLVLKEKVTKTVLMATLCIVVGCIMLVSFGSHESKQFTVEELMGLYRRPVYITYMVFLAITVLVMYAVYKLGKEKVALSAGWHRALPISYALFSGLLGTQSVLFSKTLSTLLRVTFGGNSQLGSWFTWVIILTFICTSTFWVTRLNKALKLFPALVIVPTMQISWTLFSIVSGLLYFEEYTHFNEVKGCLFVLAVVVVFFGVYLLTKGRTEDHVDGKYDEMTGDHGQTESVVIRASELYDKDMGGKGGRKLSGEYQGDMEVGIPMTGGYEATQEGQCNLNRPDGESGGDEQDLDIDSACDGGFERQAIPSDRVLMLQAAEGQGPPPRSDMKPLEREEVAADLLDEGEARSLCGPNLLTELAEDFSIDIWSSFKETMGLGPESSPAVTLFGPPAVGLESRGSQQLCADNYLGGGEEAEREGSRSPLSRGTGNRDITLS